uniref:Tenascin n=1 Tax=Spironucleus salmonicida TaxID=348837 RepID=V6LKC9_9EUKA|eukprot:EST44171.1 Tenascin [Spironucleus salmonicida]
MQLLLSKILISHENVFELLGIYPDESFALANDIYLKKSFQKVDNFVGTIDGQTFIFDNLKLDTSEATSEMFEEFSGVISNLALRFAQFDTGTPTNVYGISQNLKGTLSKISIQAEISVDGTTPQSYFLLGSTVSASISGLWASITLTAAGASQTLNVSFANVFTASVVDSTFTSSFNSDDLLNSHFTALCQANSAASSSNITVRTSFKNILAPTLNMSLVTNSFQSALNNYQLYVNVSFRDTLSSPLKNLFIISQSLPTGALLSQLKVTAYIDAETETLQTLSFLPNVQSLTMAQSFIKFTLSSSFANNSQFQIFQGPGNQITIRNTSFIVNVTKFVNGNFSTVSQQLDNSNIESCSFYIIFDMREVVIANIFVTGIVQQTTGTNLKYSNSYFSEKQNTQHSPTKLEPIIRNSNGGIVSFLASYFFIQQVPASIYLQMQNGFITNYESMNVNNCIIIFNMTMSTGTNSEYAILAQNATKTVFENITLQVIAVLEYSNQSWSVLGQGLSFNQYKNIVVYGKIQFDGHNFFMPITVLAYTLNECIIENMYLEYDLISTPLGQIQTYQFLIFNEIGENTITNFIYVGVYVNSDTLVAFQPDGVQSGLKESSTIQIIYSDQRNRFKYDTGAQISLGLDNLRNVDYMKNINLFNQSVWYYSPGINTNLPRFNFAFQTVNWKYEKFDGFNNENTELVSGTLTKNHFQPKNGPNLCQMECQGTWTFWDTPPTCLSGFTGPLCQIDCAASPCQNSGKCTDGKCECVGGFSGLACEIAHCDGCSETCELVLGDTFQCGRACVPMTTCIQGTCTENICVCNDDISSGIGDAVQCNKEDSCIFDGWRGSWGCGMNEKCECRPVVSIEIDGTCRQVTFPELGECGVIDDTYECISCLGDRLVPLCVDCIDDYKEYDSVCYPVCADCNGDCVTISGTEIHCFTCLDSFAVPECKECIPDHKEADKVCYEITNVGKGDCWLKDGATVCASCLNNYAMPTCADCIPDYLENNDICYPICPSTECRGDGCLMPTSTTFKCASCLSGFKMPECRECITGYKAVGEQCYEIIQEDQGDCWDQEGVPTCASCINNYQLPDCQQCIPDYLLVSAGCLEICKDCHGAKCVITAAAEGICESCDPGFKMPACKECEAGHTLVGSACLEVVNEDKGICWDDAGTVTCSECFKNYEVPSCQTCKAGYVEKGSECLLPCPGDVCFGENCLIEADGSYSCDSCSPRFKSPGCSTCIEDCVFVVDQCLLQVNFERGECYLLDADSFCNFCFNGFLMPDCRNCEAGFEEVEFRCMEICTDCYGTGCYVESGSSSCESCHPGFAMPSCQQCGETFVLYEGACHPGVLNANGSCIEKDGATLCISCDPAFVLSQDATR